MHPESPVSTPRAFETLGLSGALAEAAGKLGLLEPTPVQAAAIPVVLANQDLLATAQTGSGKTAAYALPLMQRLAQDMPAAGAAPATRRPVRALVLVPTRELAQQAGELFHHLALQLPGHLRVETVFGGVSINPQMLSLRGGADIVIATPGRLLDLADHNALRLDAVRSLVLDEADRMLDEGFAQELARVLALLPAKRQNLFLSATFPPAVEALARGLLHDPVRVSVAGGPAAGPDIAERAISVEASRRTELLRHLMKENGWTQALVFVATQHAAENVAWKLYNRGVHAAPFHGGLSQGARQERLAEFRNGQWDLLVTTDLAARGIDIVGLPVVVNYDLPRSPVDYTHRIGRTGRAGESGLAVSFVTPESEPHFRVIGKRRGREVPREVVAGYEPAADAVAAAAEAQAKAGTGGIKGKRPSKKDKARAAAARSPKAG
ncbi:MAG: DEAD/DEAH box helicase [Burkholderiaceae bacterium]